MKVSELIEKLKSENPDSEVITSEWNGHTSTYAVVDYIWSEEYDTGIYNDLFGTPGVVDERLNPYNWKDRKNDKTVFIGSLFPSKFAYGEDNINYDITTINGPDGDEDLVWHLNKFNYIEDLEMFSRQEYENDNLIYEITYHKPTHILHVNNLKEHIHISAEFIGIEDIRNAVELAKIPITLYV